MKRTGVSRPLDNMGRIVIPKEMRDALGLKVGDPMDIFVDGRFIIFRSYRPGCIFCGVIDDDVRVFRGMKVCPTCISDMKNAGQ